MRENDDPRITNEVVKLDSAMGGFGFKIGD